MLNYNEAHRIALQLAEEVSPTDKAKRGFNKMLADMHEDQLSSKEILVHLVSAIHSGLTYHTWPNVE